MIHSLFLIFVGAAVFGTLALVARQSLIIGYIVLGMVLGPWGLKWVTDTVLIQDISNIGIIFLLFLLGLNLSPKKLLVLLRQTMIVTLLTSAVFASVGWAFATLAGFNTVNAIIIGVACMFSSTIIGLKLLPTTVLHHRHTGEVIISVLLLQDMIAIVVLIAFQAASSELNTMVELAKLVVLLPLLVLLAWALKRWILLKLLSKYDRIQEYVFLLALAWCLGIAHLAHAIGFSHETGAFIAGITVATSPIALFISESLKPLRDFFLVMFFFALGAGLNLSALDQIWLPAILLGGAMLVVKPVIFRFALHRVSETSKLGWETGFRLGQMSEFSLLIVFVALQSALIEPAAVYFVQLATLVTFIGSSYSIVLRYPTPVAVSERLRRD
ncbi:sodium:hydrogen antiporter [Arenicella chitinivorans]|uniref:Sodium:hydrogen antiporter n=1 Tax=Arenicella chitinivorans TaxID=1329800 RepID=A0A918S0J0_9GAMM|nr:cation:proton antiporter [Arenicella chitinivorans]GHA19251.1 sodium:hydrogen antiporter [Arenicella chitinivorans]